MKKFVYSLSAGNMRCLVTQLVSCLVVMTAIHSLIPRDCSSKGSIYSESKIREIQSELKTYRVRLESEAELLKKINTHQRTEENLNVAISQKDLIIQGLKEDLVSMETKYNETLKSKEGEENKQSEEGRSETPGKEEKEVDGDQLKNDTFLLPNQLTREAAPVGIAIAIVSDNNAKELKKTLDSLIENMPATGFPVFVSHNGTNEEVSKCILSYLMKDGERTNIFHLQYSMGAEIGPVDTLGVNSLHRKWVLSTLFDKYAYSKVVVIDDYVNFAFDVFDYFQASSKLLDTDSSIMCVSAWNENGQADFAKDSGTLTRTDVFPDLAWMISAEMWGELKADWPLHGWKAWLRNREQNKERSCVIPEVCRVSVRKRPTVSLKDEQFYEQYLSKIKLNKNPVKFVSMDLGYLTKTNYDAYISQLLGSSTEISSASILKDFRGKPGDLKLMYDEPSSYIAIARILGLTPMLKEGRASASYHGIVTIRYGTWRLFIVPEGWEKDLQAVKADSAL
uniref:alpha-1,3-mannosyl-glycoprotein 2-beta-N-acetylglucosaminyltransferase n=1 Tax=Lotharella globosa TaxID=91324 RepID=A0A6V3RES1_9EUKA|mmetsp:Transcript_10503/g.20847  ORF Transcript_10503/g.20847 Transcript_10503/m.20847 type:complete len:508 (+) Transcript_10503:92-1615(+)